MIIRRFPVTPTPIGCLVGFLALFPAAFSAIAFWGSHKAFAREPAAVETGKELILWGIVALVPALLGIAFCVFRIATAGKRDHFRIGKWLST